MSADGDMVYVATITPNPTAEDDVTVQVNADAVKDAALNAIPLPIRLRFI